MISSYEEVLEAVLNLPKGDQPRILSLVASRFDNVYPGIDFQDGICGGSARLIRTRIPVWLLESLRRLGATDSTLLAAYPTINAEDLANAWAYARARAHRDEMDREIAENGDAA
jgi:uncharacterized protein (DUF433 family)